MSHIVIPKDAKRVAEIGGWTLFELPVHPEYGSLLWMNFKLMRVGVRPRWSERRVHYLTWGVDVQRLRRDGRAKYLLDHDPKLYEAVETLMRASYGPTWLLDARGGGMTEAELAAERERLATGFSAHQAKRQAKRAEKEAAAALKRMLS